NLLFGNCNWPATRFSQHSQYHVLGERIRYGQAVRESWFSLVSRGIWLPAMPGFYDRLTVFGLHRNHPRPAACDPSEFGHLLEGLPHTDKSCSTPCRIHDHVG